MSSAPTISESESRFYRQLYLRRYALLLEKAEQTYRIPKEVADPLRRKLLTLDCADVCLEKLAARLQSGIANAHC